MVTTFRPIGVENLEIAYSSPTFTIQGTGGRALSSSNPAVVTMQSNTPGKVVSVQVKANQDFIDDSGASEIINNLFGLPTGVAYSEDLPFYIYGVLSDDETAIAFMISRVPHAKTSPATANIGAPDDAVADVQGAFFSFDSLDETLYDTNPCICIGSFRMTMSAADDWTVTALGDTDGVGNFNDNTKFSVPAAAFGASANSLVLANGGVAPEFTTNTLDYYVQKSGLVYCTFRMATDGGADGTGAVITFVVCPFIKDNVFSSHEGSGAVQTPGNIWLCEYQIQPSQNYFAVYYNSAISATAFINNSAFTNGSRSIVGFLTYQIGY